MKSANPSKILKQTVKATLTPREVARECGFGVSHTYRLLQESKLPSIRVGKKFYIPRTALERWLANCGQLGE